MLHLVESNIISRLSTARKVNSTCWLVLSRAWLQGCNALLNTGLHLTGFQNLLRITPELDEECANVKKLIYAAMTEGRLYYTASCY